MKNLFKMMVVTFLLALCSTTEIYAQGDYFQRNVFQRKARLKELLSTDIESIRFEIDDESSAVLKKELQLYAGDCFKKGKRQLWTGTTLICLGSAGLIGYFIEWPIGVAGTAVAAAGIAMVVRSSTHTDQGNRLQEKARSLIVDASIQPIHFDLGDMQMNFGMAVLRDQQENISTIGPSISFNF